MHHSTVDKNMKLKDIDSDIVLASVYLTGTYKLYIQGECEAEIVLCYTSFDMQIFEKKTHKYHYWTVQK